MKRLLLCAVILASAGILSMGGPNLMQAAEGTTKEGATQAPKEGDSQGPASKVIGVKPASEGSKKEVEEQKKVEKPDKKPAGCKGGMLTMGVGC